VRSVFVIGPDKKVKAMLTYPMTTGRNFDEVLHLLDSWQLTAKHTVATPVNWQPGQDVIIPPAVSNEGRGAPEVTDMGSPAAESCAKRPQRSVGTLELLDGDAVQTESHWYPACQISHEHPTDHRCGPFLNIAT
jgi:hypothetical protein